MKNIVFRIKCPISGCLLLTVVTPGFSSLCLRAQLSGGLCF